MVGDIEVVEVHAPLPPSGSPQWGHCSGSVMANATVPDTETPRTRSGTASHWVVSECLEFLKQGDQAQASDWLGMTTPKGVVIDEEMCEGAQVFIDEVLEIADRYTARHVMLIEHKVFMPQIHEQNYGTLDWGLCLFNRDEGGRIASGKIYLYDYKYGHRENKAFANFQLVDYLEGLVNEYQIDTIAEQFVEVEFAIIQPFSFNATNMIDKWVVSIADLRGYVNQLIAKADEVFNSPTFSSGPWCRDCKAILRCQTAQKGNYSLIDYVNDPCVILNMNGLDLAVERAILDQGLIVMKARKEALDEELKFRLNKGEASDSGYALESAYGNLAWNVSNEQGIAWASAFGLDASKAEILTPTQTLKLAKGDMKSIVKEAMKSIASRPPKGLKLVKAEDSFTARAFATGK